MYINILYVLSMYRKSSVSFISALYSCKLLLVLFCLLWCTMWHITFGKNETFLMHKPTITFDSIPPQCSYHSSFICFSSLFSIVTTISPLVHVVHVTALTYTYIYIFFPLLQSHVREADLRDREPVPPSFPCQPVCLFPDSGACVFRHGVHSWRRPYDAHPHRCFHRAQSCVSAATC